MEKSPAIGIDLGTTYCCVAVYEFGSVKTIPSEQNNRKIPSYVGFTRDGHLLVGEEAKQQVALNSKNTIYNTKRLIGRRHEDDAVKSDMNYLPFNVTNNGGRICFEINFKEQWRKIYPEEITSMILVKMKEVAEAYLDTQVSDVVITVPAYFNNYQRQATKDSSEIAGLNVLRIINETSATALAYGFDKKAQGERNVMVFDLGGGTLDVSIITIDDGCFEVKAVAGDCSLGGEDFDNRLVKHFVKEFKRMYKKDISKDNEMLRCLRNVCEKAKRTLSSYNQAPVEFKSFRSSITREKFEDLCADLFESVSIPVRQTMKDVNMESSDIYEVILVGGSTQIPKIRQILQNIFGEIKLNTSMNAEEAVAYGAAVQAAMIKGEQGGYLEEMLLLDVCPFSLGIETYGGTMSSLIKRNCTIPTKQIRNTNQTNVSISIYEGEQELIKQNNLLGKFILRGTRQMLARQTIEIIYEIDIDGIFHISAIDKNTGGKMQIITSHDTRSLLQTEIDRMKRQLVVYKCEDERKMYQKLVELEDVWKCVLNVRQFLCCICFSYYKSGEGIVLRECLHIFCRDCLRNLVEFNDEAKICCPFQDDSKKCEYFLQHREIEQVASKEAFNKYLGMSLSLAFYDNIVLESSFRCLTPACPGWCVYECATEFDCPVCNHKNCINCKVIHEGFNCKEYQDDLILRAAHDEEAKQTKLQIDEMIANGSAMNCPKCQVIIVKDIGCDWMQCTICKTEICWATKGARWGPGGKGDTSGGCRCKVNGQPCTPNCMNCH